MKEHLTTLALIIDVETELTAIASGECGLCRTGCTHKPRNACFNPGTYAKMAYCGDCNHLYGSDIFIHCPMCKDQTP